MKKRLLIFCLCLLTALGIYAQENPYISEQDSKLTAQQWDAVELVNTWIRASILPSVGENGTVVFPYGASMPFVIAMPLYPSEILFEPGEVIKDFHVGDTARWKVTPAVSGSGTEQVHHIVVKPVDAGLRTALIVNTNRRSYYIHLISRKTNLIPKVAFSYPDSEQKKWKAYLDSVKEEKEKVTIQTTGEDISTLDFEYEIFGQASFKPLRVYNNGKQTIIQLPKNLPAQEAPSLLVLTPGDQKKLVNYRVKDDRYIVDELFQKAVLLTGIGKHQKKVTIQRKGGRS